MSEYRENLIDRMIRIYGFEHKITQAFANICETYPPTEIFDNTLKALVEAHEEHPVIEEDE